MSIKFVCSCGKHLRARDEMAARRSVCPRCGQPVGIPSKEPTHRGATAGPMTPGERWLSRRRPVAAPADDDDTIPIAPAPLAPAAPAVPPVPRTELVELGPDGEKRRVRPPLDLGSVKPVVPRRQRVLRRRAWKLERSWDECLLFPFRALPIIAGLAVFLGVLTALAGRVLPEVMANRPEGVGFWMIFALYMLGPVVLLAYTCGFLDCVLASAAAGEAGVVSWPGRDLLLALKSCLWWLLAFLAGPVLPAAVAPLYWLYVGEMTKLDWVILYELGFFAVGYWLLAILAVSRSDRVSDLAPLRVLKLAERLGYRAWVAAFAASLIGVGHVGLVLLTLPLLHVNAAAGLLLVFIWGGTLFLATFLFRLLGVWCHRVGA
jgi:hypothetical protein